MISTKLASLALRVAIPSVIIIGVLVMKNTVQELEGQLTTINRNIQSDIKSIHILNSLLFFLFHLNNKKFLDKSRNF